LNLLLIMDIEIELHFQMIRFVLIAKYVGDNLILIAMEFVLLEYSHFIATLVLIGSSLLLDFSKKDLHFKMICFNLI